MQFCPRKKNKTIFFFLQILFLFYSTLFLPNFLFLTQYHSF